MKSKRLFVYTEDAPVGKDVVARGMSRAGSPLLRSVSDYIDRIAVFNKHKWYGKQDIDPELAHLCYIGPRSTALLCKVLRRISLSGMADNLSTQFAIRLARSSSANLVFAYIGTDTGTLIRTARLAHSSGKAYALYLVDDFVASLRIGGADETSTAQTQAEVSAALRGAKHIFAITPGLGIHLRAAFGVTPVTLPLAFELQPATSASPPVKMQIIYVGSINFLYSAGLFDLFKVVGQIRQSSGLDLKIRLTSQVSQALQELGELPGFVIAAPATTAESLAHEIASSLFAFLPYSFGDREKAMVSTSFPSKSMEYLAYARSIVVYGPLYGVATQSFQAASLPTIVPSIKQLKEVTIQHLKLQPDYSTAYRRHLEASHSLNVTRNIFNQTIGLDTD